MYVECRMYVESAEHNITNESEDFKADNIYWEEFILFSERRLSAFEWLWVPRLYLLDQWTASKILQK